MKNRMLLHIITISIFIFFIVFGLATSPAPQPFYSVTFNLAGGHFGGDPRSVLKIVEHGKTINDFPGNPEKENNTFNGWFTARNGFGNKITGETIFYSDLTVYAHWVRN